MQSLVNLLFPPRCVGCFQELSAGALCTTCRNTLSLLSAPTCPHCDLRSPRGELRHRCRSVLGFTHLAVAFPYTHPVARAAIDALKYRGITDLASPLAHAAAQAARTQWATPTENAVLIPVPLHPDRRRKRGFSQTELLATQLGEALNIRCQTDVLEKIRRTEAQAKLPAHARKENVVGAFAATGAKPKITYILFDDVVTTGSTLRAAAGALRAAGAKNVSAITVAQQQ